ncbi:YceI family protein [Algicella marina]|nr:YceI family protein [Algicella marina]
MLKSLALAASLALSPLAAVAAPWALDKAHTQIQFSVEHFGFSTTYGIFHDFDAEIDFDPEDISATSVNFSIDATSVDTFWEARDKHVNSPDLLGTEEHPTITFVSTEVEQTGETTAKVTGDLTIREVTQSVTFDATLNKLGPSPFNPDQQIAGFTLTGEIDRTEFGVSYGAPAVGAIIPITVNLEMSPAS